VNESTKGRDVTFGDIEVGVDIIEVLRIREALQRWAERFEGRIYTPQEQAYCRRKAHPEQSYAARFAAKEAAMKALGTGWNGVDWKEIEVVRGEKGKPSLRFFGRALARFEAMGGRAVRLSLSHTENYAIAEVLLLLA
jgi:holo-[acyl-carrier protein] synthase